MDTEYLNRFEERLQQELLRLCTDYHVLDGTLLVTDCLLYTSPSPRDTR